MSKTPKRCRKYLFLIVSILMIATTVFCSMASNSSNVVSIYHTNDMHGCLNSLYSPEGKLLQIGMDVVKSIKDNDPNSILVDAGDATQGSMLASHSKGQKVMELMNAAGYDAMTLGNHEFDYGLNILNSNKEAAKFPIISANVLTSEGKPFLANDKSNGCNIIKEINGKKIGFFGICTSETLYSTNSDNVKGLVFENEITSSIKQVKELKEQGADAIVAIAHVGNLPSSIVKSEDIASKVPDIDVIIDGHSHGEYTKTIGNTVIQQSGTKSKKIGKIDLSFDKSGKISVKAKLIKAGDIIDPANPSALKYIPDVGVSDICQSAMDKISSFYKIVLGKVENGLYGGNYEKISISRITDTNLGNLMCDALIREAHCLLKEAGLDENTNDIVSLQNGGGIRDSIASGYVTMGDILNVFPFDNRVLIKKVSPKQLYEVLENGVKSVFIENGMLSGTDGAFPSVGGMRFEFDIDAEPMMFNDEKDKIISTGSRVKSVVLLNPDGTDKKHLDREDTSAEITFILNSFDCNGGDQYIMLKDIPSITGEGNLLNVVLANYIKHLSCQNKGSFSFPTDISRIHIIGKDETFHKFDAKINIKLNSQSLMNEKVFVSIDGSTPFETQTDSKGVLIINNMFPGGHDIRISKDRLYMNAYLNNKVGITSANIFLENKSDQEVNHVINIIDSMSKEPTKDDRNYIAFARFCYDSLTDEQKSRIGNYSLLSQCEAAVNDLTPNNVSNDTDDMPSDKRVLYTLLILLSIFGVSLPAFIYFKKKVDVV